MPLKKRCFHQTDDDSTNEYTYIIVYKANFSMETPSSNGNELELMLYLGVQPTATLKSSTFPS